MKAVRFYLMLMFSVLMLGKLNAQQLFLPPACYEVDKVPRDLLSGDFNHDGKLDNANLDGTGAIVDILTSSNNGTTLESIFVKGKGNTTEGMIRLFISNDGGVTYFLFTEIRIPANTQTAIVPSTINFTQYYSLILQTGFILAASTQKTELFAVAMNSTDWRY